MSTESQNELHLNPIECDGVLLLRAALRYGLDVSLYPRQILLASAAGLPELSFVHGLPGTSGLGPVTYAQDKRMRRALMERSGIPVPRGATFTMGRGVNGAKKFASELGFPVVIKPAIGDNVIETFRNLHDDTAIDYALEYLRTSPTERAGFSRAAYGLTELREPGEEDGRLIVPPGYMFLVEKQLEGVYLRFLVIDGEVHSIIRCDGQPADGSLTSGEEIVGHVHPGLKALAQQAAAVIPGLPVVTIDLVVQDPYRAAEVQETGVAEYSERPGLWVQGVVDTALAEKLGETILRAYAAAQGYELTDPRDEIAVDFEAHEIPDVSEGQDAISRAARRLGLRVDVARTDRIGGVVYGNLIGDPGVIAGLGNALLDGTIDNQRVMLAVLEHKK